MSHLIKMSRMSANYIVGKTAKYVQKSSFAHFQILLEMGTEICLITLLISHIWWNPLF